MQTCLRLGPIKASHCNLPLPQITHSKSMSPFLCRTLPKVHRSPEPWGFNGTPGEAFIGPKRQRDWWRVAGFIMEKPEKHGLVHNGKASMLQLGDSGNHQRVQPKWAPGLLACFPEILLFVTGFCFLSCPYLLFVIPGRVSGVMESRFEANVR